MHVVFFLLKIIGILLASVLGFIILLILLVLLVPITYRLNLEKQEEINGSFLVGWLLRFVSIKGVYKENKFVYYFKILGFTVKDNISERKVKKRKKRVKKRKTAKEEIKKQIGNEGTKREENSSPEDVIELIQEEIGEEKNEITISNHVYKNDFFKKIKGIPNKIKELWKKIKLKMKLLWKEAKASFCHIGEVYKKYKKISSFLKEDTNKAGMKKIRNAIKKILHHIKPRKGRGRLHFGTGDPCTTGQLSGILFAFFSPYEKSIKIIPDFEEEILEGYLFLKGRIRIGMLLIIGIRVIVDTDFKLLMNHLRKLKEEI